MPVVLVLTPKGMDHLIVCGFPHHWAINSFLQLPHPSHLPKLPNYRKASKGEMTTCAGLDGE